MLAVRGSSCGAGGGGCVASPTRASYTRRDGLLPGMVETAGKALLLVAAMLAVFGLVLLLVGRLGLGRLPGDILIERDGLTIFIPLGSMLVLSIVLSVFLYLIQKL
jgi:hypothetical protein